MLRRAMTWLTCFGVGLVTLGVESDADAGWRRRARRCCGYQYGHSHYGGAYGGWGYYGGGACGTGACGVNACATGACGVSYAQPMIYQQTAWQQPAGPCAVQQTGFQSYHHTSGYAPQSQMYGGQDIQQSGHIQQSGQYTPPPPREFREEGGEQIQRDDRPRTFEEAPEPREANERDDRDDQNRNRDREESDN